MKTLIEELQQQAGEQGQETQGGIEFDAVRDAWIEKGKPTSPEVIKDLLTNVLKDEQKAIDAFAAIGIKFADVGDEHGTAEAIDKKVAKAIFNASAAMSPEYIKQLMQIVQSGKMPGGEDQQAEQPPAQQPNQQQGQA